MKTRTFLPKKQVIFDHDGSADDFLSLILLLTMEHIDLRGISITPADCYLENALETTLKILTLTQQHDVAIGTGSYHGINAFPAEWRARPKVLNALPMLINIETNGYAICEKLQNSTDLIIEKALAAPGSVTILLTGPCTTLVHALEKEPSIVGKIQEVVWMGGAIDVPGNVRTYNHDGSAEWNVFWDPESAHKLLRYPLPLTLVPLDVTNQVPVTVDFLKRLAQQPRTLCSDLVGQFWATTIDTIPAYEYTYFMWDVLATSYLAIPEAFQLDLIELEISPAGSNAGQSFRKPGSGYWVKVVKEVNKDAFYQYLLHQFKKQTPKEEVKVVV